MIDLQCNLVSPNIIAFKVPTYSEIAMVGIEFPGLFIDLRIGVEAAASSDILTRAVELLCSLSHEAEHFEVPIVEQCDNFFAAASGSVRA